MTITVEAVYERGVLKLDHPVELADQTRVHVIIEAPAQPEPSSDTLGWKNIDELIGCIEDGPTDGARNHDKYIYGE